MKTQRFFPVAFLLLSFFNNLQVEGSSTEAQMLAIEVSGQLRPPEELAIRIDNDSTVTRFTFPFIASIHYRYPYSPDELIVGLTDTAMSQYLAGQYHAVDALNEEYGVIDIRTLSTNLKIIILTFNQIYNMPMLSNIYEQADPVGIRYAEPNYYGGDGSTIIANLPFYTFVHAWGDCPSGCINHDYYFFLVEQGQSTSVQSPALALISPIGQESLVAETMYEIKWSSLGSIPSVLIEYTDDGASWYLIDIVPNTGSYQWQVPITSSQLCKVRITDSANPSYTDSSNNDFTIYECSPSLMTDFNGDCLTNLADLAFFANQWMQCGNPFDANCLQ